MLEIKPIQLQQIEEVKEVIQSLAIIPALAKYLWKKLFDQFTYYEISWT